MPTYGQGFYGVDKYGAGIQVDFKVDPFTAVPLGYNQIQVSWTSPSGEWDSLRLIQSRTGWAANENDGTILAETSVALSEYVDSDLLDGTWYYYTLFIELAGSWYLVGTTSALSVGNTGMTDLIWDKIPRWFHYQPTNPNAAEQVWEPTAEIVDPNGPWQENGVLKGFLGILGWGMDYLRTYENTILSANDTRKAHLANVYRLSQTLGEEWEPRVPAYLMRQKVQNAGVLAQRRGTLAGLRELISTSVGYDVDLSTGPNMFLNEDQSGFANPQYDEWNPGVNYAIGDLVTFNGDVWKALAGAYGVNNEPPLSGASNTWWTQISGTTTPAMVSDVLRDPDTDAIVTWKSWVGDVDAILYVAYGASDPLDQLGNASNALWVRNEGATTEDFTVVGAANSSNLDTRVPNQDTAVVQGIPLPRLIAWDATVAYNDGDFVAFQGVAYEALRDNLNREPDVYTNDWQKIGYDERLPFKLSFWTHAGFTGVDDTTGTIPVGTSVMFFDGHGNALADPGVPSSVPILDTFNSEPHALLQDRSLDLQPSALSWSVLSGKWLAIPDGYGSVAWSQGSPGLALISGPAETAYRVAVTFGTTPLSGTQALVLSASSETPTPATYLAVERSQIVQIENGSSTASAAFGTSIQDGDRVEVAIDATAKTATVYINGSDTAAATLTFTIIHNNRYGLQIQ